MNENVEKLIKAIALMNDDEVAEFIKRLENVGLFVTNC